MEPRDAANEALKILGKAIGLDDLTLDPVTYYCAVVFDNCMLINFQLSGTNLLLGACAGILPPSMRRERLAIEMLQANYLGLATKGATLGLDNNRQIVILHQAVSLPLQVPQNFPGMVNDFLGVAQHWTRRLQGLETLIPFLKRLYRRKETGESK